MQRAKEVFVKLLKSRRLPWSKPKKAPIPDLTAEQRSSCSKFFDIEHYRKVNGNPLFTQATGLDHYLTRGWLDGLDPSMAFSTKGYLDAYPDVAAEGTNPLIHYVLHGQFENRHILRVNGGFACKIERLTRNGLRGWATDERNREMIITLNVLINGQLYATIENDKSRPDLHRHGISGGAGGFELAIPFGELEPDTYEVALELPDGSRLEEKLTIDTAPFPSLKGIPYALSPRQSADLKVVVPTFNAIEDVRICITRLREHTPQGLEVILINDGSSDPAIARELDGLRSDPMFRVLHNERNLGFTRTVNRGIAEAADADVIILNSDARVTPRWIEGMMAAAHSRPRVATVTAMSDRAGAFSAPNIGNDNPLPPGISEEAFATAFRRRSLRLYPEVPTGNGFCMLIRRAALLEIGAFDAEAFPRGYGEENDFCMRALRAGWINLIDDATYIFHDRSKSFGNEKSQHIAKGRAVVDKRYPEYKPLTRVFQSGSSIIMARYRARLAVADCTNGRGVLPRALFVLATRTGGTPQTNADLMSALCGAYECYVLVCDSRRLDLCVHENGKSRVLRTHKLQEPIEPLTHRSAEYDAVVAKWMGALDLSIVHIRHLGWHSLNLPALARETGARVVMSFHDYYALNPSLKLLDDRNVFCGTTYTQAEAHRPREIWPERSLPPLTEDWLDFWRSRMSKVLGHCDAFVTTSQSAKDRIADGFPEIAPDHFHVIPHGRDFDSFVDLQQIPEANSPIRILVPGNINEAKGLDLIAALTDLDHSGAFEFHILGGVRMEGLTEPQRARLHFHGRYDRSDFAQKVEAIAPHFGVVFSIWDETYCHTLTEMWSVGLPVAVLDFPNVRNRVEKSGAGWILEDLTVEAVHSSLAKIANDKNHLIEKGRAAKRWQTERGSAQSCRQMAARYLDLYAGRSVHQTKPKIAVLGRDDEIPSNRMLERTRNSTRRPITYIWSDAAAIIAQMQLSMIDGAIIQGGTIPETLIDRFLETAERTQTPFLLDLGEGGFDLTLDSPSQTQPVQQFSTIEKLIDQASSVTVPTQALGHALKAPSNSVAVVEDAISAELWAGGREPAIAAQIHLLYLATGSSLSENELALDILEATRRVVPDVSVRVIGAAPDMEWPSWIDNSPIPLEWRTRDTFVRWLKSEARDAIIGLAPTLDDPVDPNQSDVRVLEYGALGLPVIGSNTAHHTAIAQAMPESVKLVENTPEAWSRALKEAVQDPGRLAEQGMALQSWVFEGRVLRKEQTEFDELVRASLLADPSEARC